MRYCFLWAALWVLSVGSATAADVLVSQKDKAFQPNALSVSVGDRLIFKNDDAVTHNMFSRDADFKFNLKMQKPGEDRP